MRVGLDTNVLVYAEGVNDPERQKVVDDLVGGLAAAQIVIPVQTLGELFRVLTVKAKWPRDRARRAVSDWRREAITPPTTDATLEAALDLATDHGLSVWDAVIVNAAAEAGCRLLLSEDLQHGFVWRGLTIIDPFRPDRHPLLKAALGSAW